MPGSDNLFLDEEIYLHSVLRFFLIIVVVAEEFASGSLEHLGDNVFNQHPFVNFQFVKQEFLVNLVADDASGVESQ